MVQTKGSRFIPCTERNGLHVERYLTVLPCGKGVELTVQTGVTTPSGGVPRCQHPHMTSASSTERTSVAEHVGVSFDPSELSHASEWREISDGGYSEVFKARLLGATVAVKQATTRKRTSDEALLREIRYLHMAGPHPNIVQVYGAFSERGKMNLVMEFGRHCLRADRVARQCDHVLVLAGIARALVRLHGLNIIHRDLKARNVLVAAENRAIVIDLGLACHTILDSPEWIGRTVGTKKYRPPEMRDGRVAHASMDMYCYGLMIEKLLKQRRDRGSSDASPRSDTGRHERRDCKLLGELASECLRKDPVERPSAWHVLSKLQRHMGDVTSRCDTRRERIALCSNPQVSKHTSPANSLPTSPNRNGVT